MPVPTTDQRHRNIYEDPLSVLFTYYDFIIFLMMFPSNSSIVFLRKNLGFRLMRPWIFGVTGLCLWGFAASSSEFSEAASQLSGAAPSTPAAAFFSEAPVYIYVIAMWVLVAIHRRRGWNLILREPDPIHTMSRGDSYLSLALPFIPEWIIQRYIEPLLVFALGLLFAFPLKMTILGNWLIIASGALALIEQLTIEKSVNAFLDIRDDRIEGRAFQEADASLTAGGKSEPNLKIGGLAIASPELAKLRAARLSDIRRASLNDTASASKLSQENPTVKPLEDGDGGASHEHKS